MWAVGSLSLELTSVGKWTHITALVAFMGLNKDWISTDQLDSILGSAVSCHDMRALLIMSSLSPCHLYSPTLLTSVGSPWVEQEKYRIHQLAGSMWIYKKTNLNSESSKCDLRNCPGRQSQDCRSSLQGRNVKASFWAKQGKKAPWGVQGHNSGVHRPEYQALLLCPARGGPSANHGGGEMCPVAGS